MTTGGYVHTECFWQARFLRVLRASGSISASARAAGRSRSSVYVERRRKAAFAAAWDDALDERLDAVAAELIQRDPNRLSVAELILCLKRLRPEKYGARRRVECQPPVVVVVRPRPESDR